MCSLMIREDFLYLIKTQARRRRLRRRLGLRMTAVPVCQSSGFPVASEGAHVRHIWACG